MKNRIITLAILALLFSGCSKDFLNEINETDLNADFLYGTPEGIGLAVTALYPIQRDISNFGDVNYSLATTGLLSGDDITFTRAGDNDWAGTAWYDPARLTPLNRDIAGFWNYNYRIIGKANEVIYYTLQLDQQNPTVIQALGELYCFRAQAYFNLLRRYDNIYLTSDVVTPNNINETQVYSPADQKDVIALIKSDLDFASAHLSWTASQTGRFTKGASSHMKALVDMWPINDDMSTIDLDDAIKNVEAIRNSGVYSLMAEPKDVFSPSSSSSNSAKLNNRESILVEQWSNAIGGAPTNNSGSLSGHRYAQATLTRYDQSTIHRSSLITDMKQGGVTWGRIYPNEYLLSLYNTEKDKRYNQYFRQYFKFNNISTPLVRRLVVQAHDMNYLKPNGVINTTLGFTVPSDVAVGQTITLSLVNGDNVPRFCTTNFAFDLHPSSTKYYDEWTRTTALGNSFKDVMIYRYAETCLIGAEAYLRKGDQAKAKEFFNLTWQRAGNDAWTENLALKDILDEDAREFSQENYGHRWYVLKRFGANTMEDQIKTYAGTTNYLNNIFYSASTGKTSLTQNVNNVANYKLIRSNFVGSRNRRWPIPQTQINAMGGLYPQNPGY